MTRYKKYLQTKGIKLEHEYEYLPCEDGFEGVTTEIIPEGIGITYYFTFITVNDVILRDGTKVTPDFTF